MDESGEVEFLRQLCRSLVRICPRRNAGRWSCASCVRRTGPTCWNLRSHLFGAISLAHGEHVARERLQQLDAHWT